MINIFTVAQFLRESVEWLQKEQIGCCRYKLDDHLAIFVGWSAGYGKEKRDDVIQAKDDPDWGINAGVKVWTSDDMWTDYDFINFPYRAEDGDVWDIGMSISDHDTYITDAEILLEWYEDVKHLNIADDGMIIEEEN